MKKLLLIIIIFFMSTQVSAKQITLLLPVSDNTEASNVIVDILNAIGERMNVDFTLNSMPVNRVYNELQINSGKYDGSVVHWHGIDTDALKLIKVSEPFISSTIVAVSNEDFKIDGWESLKPYKLVFQFGLQSIKSGLEEANLESSTLYTQANCLQAVLAGRAQIVLTMPLVVIKELKTPEFKDSGLRILEPPVAAYNFYTYFFSQHKNLAQKYGAILKQIKKDGTYQAIAKKYY